MLAACCDSLKAVYHMDYSKLLLQVSAGWKHGDGGVDEQAKSHPLLKSYKALSEKVQALWCAQVLGEDETFSRCLCTHLFSNSQPSGSKPFVNCFTDGKLMLASIKSLSCDEGD